MQTEIPIATTPIGTPPTEAQPPSNGSYRAEKILHVPLLTERWNMLVTITPTQAEALLAGKWSQRPIRPARVAEFVSLIENGRFLDTHQGIAFNERGELFDGQHRLTACVKTKTAITTQAFFNQPEHHFKAYDKGAIRTLGDDLVVMGVATPGEGPILQAAARILFHLEAGRFPWTTNPHMSVDDITELLAKHPKMSETVVDCYHHRGSTRHMPPAPTGAFFTLFREVDEKQAMIFLEQLRSGADLEERDPAMQLRNGIMRDVSTKHAKARNAFMVRLVHAWNAFRSKRKVASLVSALREGKFPEISGYRAS